MRTLVGDLLEFARAGNTYEPRIFTRPIQYALDTAMVNLHGDIQTTGAEISSQGLESNASYGKGLPQVFQNLIGNAIKYRRTDLKPQIRVRCTERATDWLLEIVDNGLGFEQAHAERIFLPFQRLAGQEISGTGLGLPICKRLVERQGGQIWAESSPGEGSRFCFTLPFA
jgi:signal transduction histidine kinase